MSLCTIGSQIFERLKQEDKNREWNVKWGRRSGAQWLDEVMNEVC